MKLITILTITLFILLSCGKNENEIKKEEVKSKIITHIKEEKNKFEKQYNWEKIEGFTGYLCATNKLNTEKIYLEVKSCKQELGNKTIDFAFEGDILNMYEGDSKKEILQIFTKDKNETISTSINNSIVKNFKNIIDSKNCKSKKEEKKNLFMDKTNIEIYNIIPIGYYKIEVEKQAKKTPNISVCEGFYPSGNIIIYDKKIDDKYMKYVNNKLVDIESLQIK